MALYKLLNFAFCCIIAVVTAQDNFILTPVNTEGWRNPDELFPQEKKEHPKRLAESMEIDNCHKSLDNCMKKALDLEEALKTFKSPNIEEKSKLDRAVQACPAVDDIVKENGASVFLQRLVHRILDASHMDFKDVENINTGHIEFSISGDHLIDLREFAEGRIPLSIRKLNEILDAVVVRSFIKLPMLEKLWNKVPVIEFQISYLLFINAFLPVVVFIFFLLKTKKLMRSIIWTVPIVLMSTYITTAKQMFEEIQLKHYLLLVRAVDVPEACKQPTNTIFSFMFGGGNDCATVYKKYGDPHLNMNSMKIITRMFGETFAAFVLHLGEGTVGFYSAFNELGFFKQLALAPIIFVVLWLFLSMLLLAVTGGSVRLPYFLGSFSFSGSPKVDNSTVEETVKSRGSSTLQATPSTSSITFNINSPNPHAILRSISQASILPDDSHGPQSDRNRFTDQLAAGDIETAKMICQGSSHKTSRRSGYSSGLKKPKPRPAFSELYSKYKSGKKSTTSKFQTHCD